MKLLRRLGLYNLNWNQIRQTWNFNRWFVALGFRLRVRDTALTKILGDRRGSHEWDLSSQIYRPWHRARSAWGSEFVPDILVVAQHGRFGNMIRQVSLAIAVAEKLGIREVLVKSLPEFPRGTWALDNGVALTHDPWLRPRMSARPRLILGGDFFVKPRLPIDVATSDFDVIGRSLVDVAELAPAQGGEKTELVIHFRSGDAFSSAPHGNLGQPPLAFYVTVIQREKPSKVVLVYEDDANPVIPAVRRFMDAHDVSYSVQSGDLREDLRVLLGARSLVTGLGTLPEALLLLSPHLERWIHFGAPSTPFFRGRSFQSVVSIHDLSGEYSSQILEGNWRNSEAQRELMMKFPEENLHIVEVSGAKDV